MFNYGISLAFGYELSGCVLLIMFPQGSRNRNRMISSFFDFE